MDMFFAIAEPTRRNILEMLARDGKLAASEIARRFLITPSAISQHLKVLREAKMVTVERQAQQRIYKVNPDAVLALEKWAQQMNKRLDKSANFLR